MIEFIRMLQCNENFCLNYTLTLKTAQKVIEQLQQIALSNTWWWDSPLVNVSSKNEIVLEWWNKERQITIYVYEEVIDYIKVWGADMDNEMEDGSVTLDEDLIGFDDIPPMEPVAHAMYLKGGH